jgi:hypothetical protein
LFDGHVKASARDAVGGVPSRLSIRRDFIGLKGFADAILGPRFAGVKRTGPEADRRDASKTLRPLDMCDQED